MCTWHLCTFHNVRVELVSVILRKDVPLLVSRPTHRDWRSIVVVGIKMKNSNCQNLRFVVLKMWTDEMKQTESFKQGRRMPRESRSWLEISNWPREFAETGSDLHDACIALFAVICIFLDPHKKQFCIEKWLNYPKKMIITPGNLCYKGMETWTGKVHPPGRFFPP